MIIVSVCADLDFSAILCTATVFVRLLIFIGFSVSVIRMFLMFLSEEMSYEYNAKAHYAPRGNYRELITGEDLSQLEIVV